MRKRKISKISKNNEFLNFKKNNKRVNKFKTKRKKLNPNMDIDNLITEFNNINIKNMDIDNIITQFNKIEISKKRKTSNQNNMFNSFFTNLDNSRESQNNNNLFNLNYKKKEKIYVDDVSLLKQLQNRYSGCRDNSHARKITTLLKNSLPNYLKQKIKFHGQLIWISNPDIFLSKLETLLYSYSDYWPKSIYDTTILNLVIKGHYIGGILQKVDNNNFKIYFIGDMLDELRNTINMKSYKNKFLNFYNNKIELVLSNNIFQILDPTGRCLDIGVLTAFIISIYLTKYRKTIKNKSELFRMKKRFIRKIADKLIVIDHETNNKLTKNEKKEIIKKYYYGLFSINYKFNLNNMIFDKKMTKYQQKNTGLFNYLKYIFMIDLISFILTKTDIDFYKSINVFDDNGITIDLNYNFKNSLLSIDTIKSLSKSTPTTQKNYDSMSTE